MSKKGLTDSVCGERAAQSTAWMLTLSCHARLATAVQPKEPGSEIRPGGLILEPLASRWRSVQISEDMPPHNH